MSLTPEQALDRGRQLYEAGEYGDAEACFRAGLDLAPGSASLHSALALCLTYRAEWEAAESSALLAVKMDPSDDRAFYVLGLVFLSQDKPRLALESLEKCLALAPGDALAHALTAKVLLYTEQWEPALARSLEALAVDGDCAPAMEAYALAQRALGDFETAQELLMRFLVSHPKEWGVVEQLGWIALEQENWGVAVDCFVRSGVEAGLMEILRRRMPPYRWLTQFPAWLRVLALLSALGVGLLYPAMVVPLLALGFVALAIRPCCNGYFWWRGLPLRLVERAEFLVCVGFAPLALTGYAERALWSVILALAALACRDGRAYACWLVAGMVSLAWGSLWHPELWDYFQRALFPVLFMLVLFRGRAEWSRF